MSKDQSKYQTENVARDDRKLAAVEKMGDAADPIAELPPIGVKSPRAPQAACASPRKTELTFMRFVADKKSSAEGTLTKPLAHACATDSPQRRALSTSCSPAGLSSDVLEAVRAKAADHLEQKRQSWGDDYYYKYYCRLFEPAMEAEKHLIMGE